MGSNIQIRIPWTDLPQDLLDKIAKCLDTEIDILRFRAVCNSWRSSTTPFKKFAIEAVKLPFPFDPWTTFYFTEHDGAYFSLIERTVYNVELPGDNKQEEPNFWLVKTERSSDGKLRILNPLSHCPVKIPPETQMPKVLNTLDYRVTEVCKAYTLRYVNPLKPNTNSGYGYAKKVLLSAGGNSDEYAVMVLGNNNKLWYTKSGDEKWTMVCPFPQRFRFHDIVCYKGQVHGIDRWGSTWAFDLNFGMTRVSSNIHNNALKRYLVELYGGELFLVEEMNKRRPRLTDERPLELHRNPARKPDVNIIIYALDKNKKEWVITKAVNDFVIVVSDDCSYAVSTKEFKGCKGTRVFYPQWRIFTDCEDVDPDYADFIGAMYTSSECYCSDCYRSYGHAALGNSIASDEVKLRFRGFHVDTVGVCNCESGETGSVPMFPEYADILWPPPSWLCRT